MSKAFTKESDNETSEAIPLRVALPPGVANLITPEGATRLQRQLDDLTDRKRLASKDNPSSESLALDGRIRQLQQILDSVVITKPSATPGRVAFGSVIVVEQSDGEKARYRIVGVNETDLSQGHISWRSPLARALISKRASDEIRFESPEGIERLKIISVEP